MAPKWRSLVLLALALTTLGLSGCLDNDLAPLPEPGPMSPEEPAEPQEPVRLEIPVRIWEHHLGGPALRWDDVFGLDLEAPDDEGPFWDREPQEDAERDIIRLPEGMTFWLEYDGFLHHQPLRNERFTATPKLAERGIDVVLLRLDMYRSWNVTMDAQLEPVTSRWTGGAAYWEPMELKIHDHPDANRAYIDTLQQAGISMRYTTSALSNADLGIGFGTSPDEVLYVHDTDSDPGFGDFHEHLNIDAAAVQGAGLNLAATFYAGPVSSEPIVAVEPLKVQMEAWFSTQEPGIGGVPGPSVAVVLLAGLVVLLWARRTA